MQALGEKISQKRREKKYTQAVLAEKLFISPQAISKWETGKSLPDIATLKDLATLLECSVDDFLQDSSDEHLELQVLEEQEEVGYEEAVSTHFVKNWWWNVVLLLVNAIFLLFNMEYFFYEHAGGQYVILVLLIMGTISSYLFCFSVIKKQFLSLYFSIVFGLNFSFILGNISYFIVHFFVHG